MPGQGKWDRTGDNNVGERAVVLELGRFALCFGFRGRAQPRCHSPQSIDNRGRYLWAQKGEIGIKGCGVS